MDKRVPGVNKLVVPAPVLRARPAPSKISHGPRKPGPQVWAPAWFYSALHWLGKSYYDANNVQQRFNAYIAGSNVDPYAQLGATRLFLIFGIRDGFRLSIAPDLDAPAPSDEGQQYANTDEGIREMYLALTEAKCSRT